MMKKFAVFGCLLAIGWVALGNETPVVDDGALARTIAAAIAKGERAVTLPKATYRLQNDGGCFFTIKGVKDFTVDFSGSHLIGLAPMRMFALADCTNVTVRNVSYDYDPLPFTQAVIEKVSDNGDWDVKVIEGYPDPDDCGDNWPVQVFDPVHYEMKNSMRCWAGFKLVKTGSMRYHMSGGQNKTGAVGDICVWSIKPFGHYAHNSPTFYTVCLDRCTRCRLENVTAYSAPNLFCMMDLRGDGNAYVNCVIDRCPPERDYQKRGLKRLRSGNHDGLNSRMAKKGPLVENCTIRYQSDDCVNVSGQYVFVSEVRGNQVRILDKVEARGFGDPIAAGDILQVMSAEGVVRAPVKVLSVVRDTKPRAEEIAFMNTLGLWQGQACQFETAYLLTVEEPNPIERTDAIVSENARGNGFVIRNCTFGPNRALGVRVRGAHGLVESNEINRVEGWAVVAGPEYEWFEGGVFSDLTVRGNLFGGCGGSFSIGGAAARHKSLPPRSFSGFVAIDNRESASKRPSRFVGCEDGVIRNTLLPKPRFRGMTRKVDALGEADFKALCGRGENLVRCLVGADPASSDRLAKEILPLARKYNAKIIVDLQVPPGPRTAEGLAGLWRSIATHLQGNEDVIYGYAVVRARRFQRALAKAIRKVDPKTPIIVGLPDRERPGASAELKPMNGLGEIVYQVSIGQSREKAGNREAIRQDLAAARAFERRTGAKICVGDSEGTEAYQADCIAVFTEYGWDWTREGN